MKEKELTFGRPLTGSIKLRIAIGVAATLMCSLAHGQTATTTLSLRSDVNACFNNGSSSRTISTTEGASSMAEVFSLGASGSVSYDFYSAPLSSIGPSITTSDKMKLKVALTNSMALSWKINLNCVAYDYDPANASQVAIASAAGTALQVDPGTVVRVSTGADGVSPGTTGMAAGHLIKLTITITRNSGSVTGQFIYGLNSAAALELPRGRTVTWSFGSFSPVTSIVNQPTDQTVCAGMTTSFSINASSSGPLIYQWRKNGVNLTDSPGISGTTTPTLLIGCCSAGDAAAAAAGYDCLVASSCGAPIASSRVALTVNAGPGQLALTGNPASGVGITFTGTPGVQYRIQATTNLAAPVWTPISTNLADASGWISYVDPGASNFPVRFYRAVFP